LVRHFHGLAFDISCISVVPTEHLLLKQRCYTLLSDANAICRVARKMSASYPAGSTSWLTTAATSKISYWFHSQNWWHWWHALIERWTTSGNTNRFLVYEFSEQFNYHSIIRKNGKKTNAMKYRPTKW